jgi:PhnO protein
MASIVNIRKIERDDFEFVYHSLCDLENQIMDFSTIEGILKENTSNPDYLYLVAEVQSKRVGFITFHTQKLMHHAGGVGEIQEFYITPNNRGMGIGKQLVQFVLEFAERKELKSIEVTTNKRREENVDIYQNLGFNLTHNKFTIYK